MGAVFGTFSIVPLWLVFFGTREREEFMHQPPKGIRQVDRAPCATTAPLCSAW